MEDVTLQLRSFIGLFLLAGLAWLLGPRKRVPIALLIGAIGLQLGLTWLLYTAPPFRAFLTSLTGVVEVLQRVTDEGAQFVFGYLAGSEAPWIPNPDADGGAAFLFAFQALPMVIVLSALSALLWRWRVLEVLVQVFALAFRRLLNLSGAASLGAAANIFLGMTESPVLIRPRLPDMSRSDLFLIMTVGFSTVAGSVMAVYVSFLDGVIQDAAGHIFTASLISIPAAVLLARLMMPPEAEPEAEAPSREKIPQTIYQSSMDALTTGVSDGIRLYINIIFMLLVFTSLVALVNVLLTVFPDFAGAPLTVDRILGWLFAPIVWIAGIPWSEATDAGALMGLKTALNELIAYSRLAEVSDELSPRTSLIMTYAVCGFANFSSIGILTGGLVAIAPSRREDILQLAPLALVSGTLATLMTGAAVGTMPMSMFGL